MVDHPRVGLLDVFRDDAADRRFGQVADLVALIGGFSMFAFGAYTIRGVARMRTVVTPQRVTASGFRTWRVPLLLSCV